MRIREKDGKYLNCVFLQGNVELIEKLTRILNPEVPFYYEEADSDDFYFMLLCKNYAMYQIMLLKSDEINFVTGYKVHKELEYSKRKFNLCIEGNLQEDKQAELLETKKDMPNSVRIFNDINELAKFINKYYQQSQN